MKKNITISKGRTRITHLNDIEFLHEWFRIRMLIPYIGDFNTKDFTLKVSTQLKIEIIIWNH